MREKFPGFDLRHLQVGVELTWKFFLYPQKRINKLFIDIKGQIIKWQTK
jgi:hypothetical protein